MQFPFLTRTVERKVKLTNKCCFVPVSTQVPCSTYMNDTEDGIQAGRCKASYQRLENTLRETAYICKETKETKSFGGMLCPHTWAEAAQGNSPFKKNCLMSMQVKSTA